METPQPSTEAESKADESGRTIGPHGQECRPAQQPPKQRRRTPTRTAINYWVDALLLVTFLMLCWVSGVVYFVFPRGISAYEYVLWGRTIDDWSTIQFAALCTLAALVVLHLMLHWNWICSVTNTHVLHRPPGRDDGSRTLLGVGLLVAVLHVIGIGILAAQWALESSR